MGYDCHFQVPKPKSSLGEYLECVSIQSKWENTISSKKQANRHTIESGETVYDVAKAPTAVSAAPLPADRGPSAIYVDAKAK
jgi:hypothetical protein